MAPLRFKGPPAEQEQHTSKKAKKSARKSKKDRSHGLDCDEGDDGLDPRKKRYRRTHSMSPRRDSGHHSSGYYNQTPYADNPGSSSHTRGKDYYDNAEDEAAARARMENERFEEKLRDALEDDGLYDSTQRLDNVEARLNSYAHIPRRWRGTDEGFSAGLWMEDAREDIGLEPWQMNDDEYAEYIRAGMYRKKNRAEYEERLRKKEELKLRKERERRLREETRRLEQEAQAEREKRSAEKVKWRLKEARRLYEERWTALLSRPSNEDRSPLTFDNIPWPIAPPKRGSIRLCLDELTKDAVSSFLLRPKEEKVNPADDAPLPSSKDVLRTTMLRFHPDKFEARILACVTGQDKELVKDTANMVVRILNELIKEHRA